MRIEPNMQIEPELNQTKHANQTGIKPPLFPYGQGGVQSMP